MRNRPGNSEKPPTEYVDRINRAIDFILLNLHRPHRLEDVARAAPFSAFHFHRVFRGVVGETPSQFTKRLRLERALTAMSHNPARSLTDVALDCGFSSSSDFSRCFKQRYGAAPSVFDLDTWRASKRNGLSQLVEQSNASLHVHRLPAGENPDGFVADVIDLPPRPMAYLRVLDPYREGVVASAAERLVAWAQEAGHADGAWYGYMWDDPDVVAMRDCRYDVAVEAEGFAPGGEIGRFEFPAMRVARVAVRGGIDLEMRALDWIYRTWLPTSGYVPDDQPCFEAWIGRPFARGLERFELDIHLPVRADRGC